MVRIIAKTPSTGASMRLILPDVGTGWTTIAEAPDFSVSDPNVVYPARDPTDADRAIRAGEVYFTRPIVVSNKHATETCWVEFRVLRETGAVLSVPGRIVVPALDARDVTVQALVLQKLAAAATNGDRLQVRAQTAARIDLWGAAVERPVPVHILDGGED
jgi:hypothetical protein